MLQETAYVTAEAEYGGYGRHLATSLLPGNPGQLMNNCEVYVHFALLDEDGTLIDQAKVPWDWFPANQLSPPEYSGLELEKGQKIVNEIYSWLSDVGFHITANGPYWCNLSMERSISSEAKAIDYRGLTSPTSTQEQGGGHPFIGLLVGLLVIFLLIFLLFAIVPA